MGYNRTKQVFAGIARSCLWNPNSLIYFGDSLHSRCSYLLFLSVFLTIGSAFAQNNLTVSEAQLYQHLIHRVEPVYPPEAKSNLEHGRVVLDISLSPEGKLLDVNVISGHFMLQEAASDAVWQWQFSPFELNGHKVSASGEISVDFYFPGEKAPDHDVEILARYSAQYDLCHEAVQATNKTPKTIEYCTNAAEIANQFAPDTRIQERLSANTYAALVLADKADFNTALVYANRAVAAAQQDQDDLSAVCFSFELRALIRHNLNDLQGAEKDTATVMNYSRKALELAISQKSSAINDDRKKLESVLKLHSEMLIQLNREPEALQEIDQLKDLQDLDN